MSNPPQQPNQQLTAQQQQLRMLQQRMNTASPQQQQQGNVPNQQQVPFNLNMPVGVANTGPSNAAGPGRPPSAPPLTPVQLAQMIELAKNGQLPKNQVEQLQRLMASYTPNQARPPAPAPPQPQQTPQPVAPQATGAPAQRPPAPNAAVMAQSNAKMIAALQGLASMSEAARSAAISQNPQLGALYERWQITRRTQATAAAGGANANNGGGPPNPQATATGQQANVRPQGNFGANAALPNLQLPPNRVRNPNAPNMPAQGGAGPSAANMQQQPRPNMPSQARPPSGGQNQQQFQSAQASRVGSPAVGGPNGQQQQQQGSGANPSADGTNANAPRPGGAGGQQPMNRTNSPLTVPASQTGPSPHPNQAGPRPTLSTGLPAGPTMGTPSLLQRSGQGWDEASRAGVQAKSDLGTIEGRKRKIREVLDEVEKGEKLEDGVEDLLLEVIDELIDSSTQFASRLAKHRGSNTLEVRDLQLHFERNHNIRIPGMGSDELNQFQSQSVRRHPALSQHAQRLQAVNAARAAHQAGAPAAAAAAASK